MRNALARPCAGLPSIKTATSQAGTLTSLSVTTTTMPSKLRVPRPMTRCLSRSLAQATAVLLCSNQETSVAGRPCSDPVITTFSNSKCREDTGTAPLSRSTMTAAKKSTQLTLNQSARPSFISTETSMATRLSSPLVATTKVRCTIKVLGITLSPQ